MRCHRIIGVMFLLALFGAPAVTPAAAQWWKTPPKPAIRFAEMDRDGDGVITRAEWRGSRRDFDEADWNHDGVLSGDEVRLDARDSRDIRDGRDADAPRDAATLRREFLRLDVNNDGIVTTREWKNPRSEFKEYDVNRDGVLTLREYVGQTDRGARQAVVQRVVDVDPRVRWVYSGIVVDKGDILTLNTDGSVQLSDDAEDVAISAGAPSGRRAPDAPLPQTLAGALIGRIGDGAPFGVGDLRQIVAPESGQLFFAVNDDHLADNHGWFHVRLSVRPPY